MKLRFGQTSSEQALIGQSCTTLAGIWFGFLKILAISEIIAIYLK